MQFTEKFAVEYAKRAHAIQSGVAMTMNHNAKPTEPKHLRTGLNTVMCDLGAVTALLVTKGLLTQEEVEAAILKNLDEEIARYEADLTAHFGGKTKITLS